MGVRFLLGFRRRYYKAELQFCNKLKVKSLPFEIVLERHNQLNNSNFKSEIWFINLLNKIDSNIDLNINCHRNYPVLNRYFADFFFNKINTVIEIDGKSHDFSKEYDDKRDELFRKRKFKVIRIKHGDLITAEKIIYNLIIEHQIKTKKKIKSSRQKQKILKNKKSSLGRAKSRFYWNKIKKIQNNMDQMMLNALKK